MSEKNIALIATLPKSGTWYARTFFWCYDQLIRNSEEYLKGSFVPDLVGLLRDKRTENRTHHSDTFGLDTLYITHSFCPGMQIGDPHYAEWEALYVPLFYNCGEQLIRDHDEWKLLDPAKNPDARIVYFYRNPLDHFVSYYRHTLNHVDESHRFKVLADGTRHPIEDLHDFTFNSGVLGAFIRHYYSFKSMQAAFPENIMLMPYEELTRQPEASFTKILSFLRVPMHRALFEKALDMSSRKSLSAIEDSMGRSLAADQSVASERHIRDGSIGKWSAHYSQEDVERIESILNVFDISLKEFTLTDTRSEAPIVPQLTDIAPIKQKNYQLRFLKRQLAWKGSQIALMHSEITKLKRHMLAFQLFKRSRIAAPLRALVNAYRKFVAESFQAAGSRKMRALVNFNLTFM